MFKSFLHLPTTSCDVKFLGLFTINIPSIIFPISNCNTVSYVKSTIKNPNIIVGDLQPDDFSQLRHGAMTFYGRIITDSKGDMLKQPYIGTMLMDDARKIINHK